MGMLLKSYMFVTKDMGKPTFFIIDAFTDKRGQEKVVELSKQVPTEKPLVNWEYVKIDELHPFFSKEREVLFEVVDTKLDYQKEANA